MKFKVLYHRIKLNVCFKCVPSRMSFSEGVLISIVLYTVIVKCETLELR
jgi:hypothetical protein